MSASTDISNTRNATPSTSEAHTGPLETPGHAANQEWEEFPPNTPLAASTTSFVLGSLFSIGIWLIITKSGVLPAILYGEWHKVAFNRPIVQLPFFVAAWAFFHWAEFAVTAGWNRDKCSTHCKQLPVRIASALAYFFQAFLLDNGQEYHIAHSVAIAEYLITVYFFPNAKTWPYVTPMGPS